MKTVANEEKAEFAKNLNIHKGKMTELFNQRKIILATEALEAAMKRRRSMYLSSLQRLNAVPYTRSCRQWTVLLSTLSL